MQTLEFLIRLRDLTWPTHTEIEQIVDVARADARALWAVRVLDFFHEHKGKVWAPEPWPGGGWVIYTRSAVPVGVGWRGWPQRHTKRHLGETIMAARLAAADALVAEDPELLKIVGARP